jgi:hypothetical protein
MQALLSEKIKKRRCDVYGYIHSFLHENAIRKHRENISQHYLDSCVSAATKLEEQLFKNESSYMTMSHDDIKRRIIEIKMMFEGVNPTHAQVQMQAVQAQVQMQAVQAQVQAQVQMQAVQAQMQAEAVQAQTFQFLPQSSGEIRLTRTNSEELVESTFAAISLIGLNSGKSRSNKRSNKRSNILQKITNKPSLSTRSGRLIRQTEGLPLSMLNPYIAASKVKSQYSKGWKI